MLRRKDATPGRRSAQPAPSEAGTPLPGPGAWPTLAAIEQLGDGDVPTTDADTTPAAPDPVLADVAAASGAPRVPISAAPGFRPRLAPGVAPAQALPPRLPVPGRATRAAPSAPGASAGWADAARRASANLSTNHAAQPDAAPVAPQGAQPSTTVVPGCYDAPELSIGDDGVTARRRPGLVEQVTWDDLVEVAIRSVARLVEGAGRGQFWLLGGRSGTGVVVPAVGPASDALLQRLQRLPGFDNRLVVKGLANPGDALTVIWRER